jgi:hypothetical protein
VTADPHCPACGTTQLEGAHFCARCGRARDDIASTVVELSPLGTPRSVTQTAVVSTRANRPPRARTIAGIALASALAVGGVIVLIGNDTRSNAAAPPPSTQPATSSVPTSTAGPESVVTAAASVPRAVVVPAPSQNAGQVLDPTLDGRSLYLWDGATITRVELTTGRVSAKTISAANWDSLDLTAFASGRLVLTDTSSFAAVERHAWSLAADLSGEMVEIDVVPAGANLIAAEPEGLWVYYNGDAATRPRMQLLDFAGRQLTAFELPENFDYGDPHGTRLLNERSGRIWTIGPDGARPYAIGKVAASAGDHVLWTGCADDGRCTYRLGTSVDPDIGELSPAASSVLNTDASWIVELSPDARSLITKLGHGDPECGFAVVDITIGPVLEFCGTPGAWSPDGAWLFTQRDGSQLIAINVRTGERVRLDIAGITDGTSPLSAPEMLVG